MTIDDPCHDAQPEVVAVVESYLAALLARRPPVLRQRAHLGLVAGTPTRGEAPDLPDLERAFVTVAAAYGASAAISRAAWIEFGVPVHLLDQAGIG